jgi:hypothetical protein
MQSLSCPTHILQAKKPLIPATYFRSLDKQVSFSLFICICLIWIFLAKMPAPTEYRSILFFMEVLCKLHSAMS